MPRDGSGAETWSLKSLFHDPVARIERRDARTDTLIGSGKHVADAGVTGPKSVAEMIEKFTT